MKIEVGAGDRPAPGFLSVDLNPRRADVVADATQLPFRTGSITGMRAVDVLEHISYRDTDRVLQEWSRVCARGARLYVQVPDASTIMRQYATGIPLPTPPDLPATALAGAMWRLLGGHDDGERVDTAAGDDWRWNAHYAFFSNLSLAEALDAAAFDVITCTTNPFPNLCCTARRR